MKHIGDIIGQATKKLVYLPVKPNGINLDVASLSGLLALKLLKSLGQAMLYVDALVFKRHRLMLRRSASPSSVRTFFIVWSLSMVRH